MKSEIRNINYEAAMLKNEIKEKITERNLPAVVVRGILEEIHTQIVVMEENSIQSEKYKIQQEESLKKEKCTIKNLKKVAKKDEKNRENKN